MTLYIADSVFLISPYKPVLMILVVSAWAWIVSTLDKDLDYYFLRRKTWNGIQIGTGIFAVLLWLLIPYFWLGLAFALLVMGGAIGGYVYYRNSQVPADAAWTLSMDSLRQAMEEKAQQSAQKHVTVHILAKDGTPLESPVGDSPQAKAHLLFQNLVQYALPRGADLVELATDGKKADFVVRIDGVGFRPELETPVDTETALAMINYLKGAGGMDLADRRKKQVADINIEAEEHGKHLLTVSTWGSTQALRLSILINPHDQVSIPFNELGLLESQRDQLRELFNRKGQIMIVTCPSNNGQTSTLYSLVQMHDPYTQSVWTLEDKVPYELEGVSHEALPAETPEEQIVNRVQVVYRRDPNVVLYARQLTEGPAKVMAKYAREVRTYIGMTRDDAFSALRKWLSLVGNLDQATESLSCIISQRLVRKLCVTCKAPYQPDAAAMKKLNLPADRGTTLYKASGQVLVNKKPQKCPDCMGMGYRGRTGVYEVMVFDEPAKKLVAARKIDELRRYQRQQKLLWLQEAALAKVLDGTTDIKEITRAFAGVKDYSQETTAGKTATGIAAIKSSSKSKSKEPGADSVKKNKPAST